MRTVKVRSYASEICQDDDFIFNNTSYMAHYVERDRENCDIIVTIGFNYTDSNSISAEKTLTLKDSDEIDLYINVAQ